MCLFGKLFWVSIYMRDVIGYMSVTVMKIKTISKITTLRLKSLLIGKTKCYHNSFVLEN